MENESQQVMDQAVDEGMSLEDKARERMLNESIDPQTGDFKSLGHSKRYFEEDIPQDGPNPFHYTVDQEEKFKEDLSVHRQKSAVREGVKEAISPSPPPWLPDDELWAAKKDAVSWKEDCLKKAAKAEADGKYTAAKAWKDRGEFKEKDLEAMGPSKRDQIMEDYKFHQSACAVVALGEAGLDNHPIWNEQRMQDDSGVEIHRHNRNPRAKYLVLPKEESPWGNIEKIKPSNTVFFELPQDKMAEVQSHVYANADTQDPDALSRRAWAYLHKIGYASQAKPTIYYPTPETEVEEKNPKATDLDPWGSQKEYVKWLNKRQARR